MRTRGRNQLIPSTRRSPFSWASAKAWPTAFFSTIPGEVDSILGNKLTIFILLVLKEARSIITCSPALHRQKSWRTSRHWLVARSCLLCGLWDFSSLVTATNRKSAFMKSPKLFATKNFVDMGVSGFWNDMNEPSVFLTATKTMPLDVRHRLDDGTTLPHLAIHNVFGMENVRATEEGLLKLRPNERPFVLTRAAYAGTQRYAATWTV